MSVHPTAEVSPDARIGSGTHIWHHAQVRERAVIGCNCVLGKGVYVDFDVVIGDNVKIQNYALLYHGVTVEDGVFIGPHACLANDRFPRAITPDGRLKTDADWTAGVVRVAYGASIGAGAVVLPGVVVGRFALVGAGAVLADDAPDHGLMLGVPARSAGWVCRCGRPLQYRVESWICPDCGETPDFARLFPPPPHGGLRPGD